MGIQLEDVTELLCVVNTAGGETYIVDGTVHCFRPIVGEKNSGYCSHTAGFGTSHVGTGACTYHENVILKGHTGEHLGNGRYATVLTGQLKRYYLQFAREVDLTNLGPELILMRAILAKQLKDGASPVRLADTIVRITNIVERMHRIENEQILTASVAKLLMVRVLDIVGQFIDSDKMPEFLELWQSDTAIQTVSKPLHIDLLSAENDGRYE